MTKKEMQIIFDSAFTHWGMGPQLVQMMEECGELTQAASKLWKCSNDVRKAKGYEMRDLIEEIADVQLICELVTHCSGFEKQVNEQKSMKANRLDDIIKCRLLVGEKDVYGGRPHD